MAFKPQEGWRVGDRKGVATGGDRERPETGRRRSQPRDRGGEEGSSEAGEVLQSLEKSKEDGGWKDTLVSQSTLHPR